MKRGADSARYVTVHELQGIREDYTRGDSRRAGAFLENQTLRLWTIMITDGIESLLASLVDLEEAAEGIVPTLKKSSLRLHETVEMIAAI
jgi:leucyl-tRNA synthetase